MNLFNKTSLAIATLTLLSACSTLDLPINQQANQVVKDIDKPYTEFVSVAEASKDVELILTNESALQAIKDLSKKYGYSIVINNFIDESKEVSLSLVNASFELSVQTIASAAGFSASINQEKKVLFLTAKKIVSYKLSTVKFIDLNSLSETLRQVAGKDNSVSVLASGVVVIEADPVTKLKIDKVLEDAALGYTIIEGN